MTLYNEISSQPHTCKLLMEEDMTLCRVSRIPKGKHKGVVHSEASPHSIWQSLFGHAVAPINEFPKLDYDLDVADFNNVGGWDLPSINSSGRPQKRPRPKPVGGSEILRNFTNIYTKDPQVVYAACNHCGKILKLIKGGGSTNSLLRHITTCQCKPGSSEGATVVDITKEMFQKHAGNVLDQVKLGVVYIQPPSPMREGSAEVLLPRSSWSNGGNINDQDATRESDETSDSRAHKEPKELTYETGSMPHHMTLQYLKDITNNFCNEWILGKGGFGVVYKGVLDNGTMIAVKKLVQSMSSSQEQFENEVILLMKLKHPNIVQLVGYCYETQHLHNLYEGKPVFAWNTECLLCLECLPKGSLDEYISDASSGLDWPTRYKIIEGISNGLQYLHEQDGGPIIHLDLKPANILLDENMIPKITDFGLSRLYDQKQTIHTAITSGTLGYMPPEYLRGIITPMSDIFSLGVIIMEVITGHREYPNDIRKSSTVFIELELQKWRNVLPEEPSYLLEADCLQIKRCIQIGLICVNSERTKRPTMKKIIDMLQGLESMDWYISNELSSNNSKVEP